MVRVNDRGPYVGDRVIDVSVKTAKLLGFYGKGVTKVKVEYVGRAPLAGSDDRKLAATLRDRDTVPVSQVKVASAEPYTRRRISIRARWHPCAGRRRRPSGLMRWARARGRHSRNRAPRAAAPTVELAAATRPTAAPSPVSAYAPVRYDGLRAS